MEGAGGRGAGPWALANGASAIDRGDMASMESAWRGRAAISALIAGAVWVVVLVIEGPPGSGYGWESVAISAGFVAVIFILMAYFVRFDSAGRALASAALAIVAMVMSAASLIGNWEVEPAAFRVLETIFTLFTVAAGGVVFTVAAATVRHSRSRHSHVAS